MKEIDLSKYKEALVKHKEVLVKMINFQLPKPLLKVISIIKLTFTDVGKRLLLFYKSVILFFILLLGFLIILPVFIENEIIKEQIEQKFNQKLGYNLEIEKVDISFIGGPQISLFNSKINLVIDEKSQSQINVPLIKIKPKISSLFFGKLKIKYLTIDSAKITTSNIDKDQPPSKANIKNTLQLKTKFFNKILNFADSDEIFDFKNIDSIESINSSFYYQANGANNTFNKINFLILNQIKKQNFIAEGSFFSEEMPTNFSVVINTNDDKDSIIKLSSPIINLSASGKFKNSQINNLSGSNFIGKFDAEIVDLKAVLYKYFSKNCLLCRKINANQPIGISAKIVNYQGELKLENILLKSNLVNGSGAFSANFISSKPRVNIDFNLDNLDIDKIWFSGALDVANIVPKNIDFVPKINKIIDHNDVNKSRIIDQLPLPTKVSKPLFKDINLNVQIKIKSANYYYASLENVILSVKTSDSGDVLLQSLSALIPGGLLQMDGVFEQEENVPKISGNLNVEGNDLYHSISWLNIVLPNLKPNTLSDYKLSTNYTIFPHLSFFGNINLSVNGLTNSLVGNLKIDNSGITSVLETNLKIDRFDYSQYFSTNQPNAYLIPGSLLKKLLWLNTVNSVNNINLSFDNLLYDEEDLGQTQLSFEVGQGYFKLLDFNSHSAKLDLKTNFDVDITKNNPTFNLSAKIGYLQYENLKNDPWQSFFDLPSLESFNGKINVELDKVRLNSWQGNDIKIQSNLKNGVINIDDFNFKTYQASGKYSGEVIIKNFKTINGSLALEGVDNNQFLSNIFNIKNISGISNVVAVINSSAENKKEFFTNIKGGVKFVSSNVRIDGFGLGDLSSKMIYANRYKQELTEPLKILYNQNAKSFFKDVSGELVLNKDKNQFNIQSSIEGTNGVIYGAFDQKQNFDGTANFIFMVGTLQKPIPVSLAINFKGQPENIINNTNLEDIKQKLGY